MSTIQVVIATVLLALALGVELLPDLIFDIRYWAFSRQVSRT